MQVARLFARQVVQHTDIDARIAFGQQRLRRRYGISVAQQLGLGRYPHVVTRRQFPHQVGHKTITQSVVDTEVALVQIHVLIAQSEYAGAACIHRIKIITSGQRVEETVVSTAEIVSKPSCPTSHFGVEHRLFAYAELPHIVFGISVGKSKVRVEVDGMLLAYEIFQIQLV